jgi:hypothetical protein
MFQYCIHFMQEHIKKSVSLIWHWRHCLATKLFLWNRILLEKLIVTQLVEKFSPPPFMEPEGSLPCSQEPAAGPYPEPDESSGHLPSFPSTPRSSDWSLPFRFSDQSFRQLTGNLELFRHHVRAPACPVTAVRTMNYSYFAFNYINCEPPVLPRIPLS